MRLFKRNELSDEVLINLLEQMDYSKTSDKDRVKANVMKKIVMIPKQKDILGQEMKRGKKHTYLRQNVVAACILIVGVSLFANTAWADELVGTLCKIIDLGHIMGIQEGTGEEAYYYMIPKELIGEVFDENGNKLEQINDKQKDQLYTKEGEKIAYINEITEEIVTEAEEKKREERLKVQNEENIWIEKDMNQIAGYLCFNPKIPEYLPEDYSFNRAEFYKDFNGEVKKNSKYVSIYYKNKNNGEEIWISERVAGEETGYAFGDKKLESITINGKKAILSGDRSIDWQEEDVLIGMTMSRESKLSKEEFIKMAESMK